MLFMGTSSFYSSRYVRRSYGLDIVLQRHKLCILRLWNRLVMLEANRLTCKIFLWDQAFAHLRNTWSGNVSAILRSIGMETCFTDLEPCDITKATETLLMLEQQSWNTARYKKAKLRYYNMFKSDLCQEEYTSFNIPKYKRSPFAQFRAGILQVEIER